MYWPPQVATASSKLSQFAHAATGNAYWNAWVSSCASSQRVGGLPPALKTMYAGVPSNRPDS